MITDILFEHTENQRKKLSDGWNERVSKGKEMSTSLDTEYNGMNVIDREKEKSFLMNLLVGFSDDSDSKTYVVQTTYTKTALYHTLYLGCSKNISN